MAPCQTRGPALPALFLCVASAFAGTAGAQEWSASLAVQRGRYAAIERFESGAIADEESGRVGGGELQLDRAGDRGRWTVRWQRWHDAVAYRGASHIGLPVWTTTDLAWSDAAFAGQRTVWQARSWTAALGGSLGRRTLHRSIEPTFFSTRLTERLTSTYASVGGSLSVEPHPAWAASVHGSLEYPLRSRLRADFHGAAEPVTVAPSGRTSSVHGISASLRLARGLRLSIGWRRHGLHLGHSAEAPYIVNGQATGTQVRYPGSAQRLDVVCVGTTLSWR